MSREDAAAYYDPAPNEPKVAFITANDAKSSVHRIYTDLLGKVDSASGLPPATAAAGNRVGDAYLDLSTGAVHRWDGNGWTLCPSVQGPTGPTGPQGDSTQIKNVHELQGTGAGGAPTAADAASALHDPSRTAVLAPGAPLVLEALAYTHPTTHTRYNLLVAHRPASPSVPGALVPGTDVGFASPAQDFRLPDDWRYFGHLAGVRGPAGPLPVLAAPTARTVDASTPARVSVTGDGSAGSPLVFAFDVPRGHTGAQAAPSCIAGFVDDLRFTNLNADIDISGKVPPGCRAVSATVSLDLADAFWHMGQGTGPLVVYGRLTTPTNIHVVVFAAAGADQTSPAQFPTGVQSLGVHWVVGLQC